MSAPVKTFRGSGQGCETEKTRVVPPPAQVNPDQRDARFRVRQVHEENSDETVLSQKFRRQRCDIVRGRHHEYVPVHDP